MKSQDPIIQVRNVGKRFHLRAQRPFLMNHMVLRLCGKTPPKDPEFWALRDVSFEVPRGGSLGIIGGNGAGKSTLLSLLIGASNPTLGSIDVQGRVSALLELGAGFHPDLTGRENILLNASLSGLSRAEIESKMEDIIDFSELGDFINVPIRNYSSGMQVRLGFSVAIHIDPEILIVDEALAVGDQGFQEKCMERIHKFVKKGVTFLVVSHGLETVTNLCDKALWLNHGRVVEYGDSATVCENYRKGPPSHPGDIPT